MARCILGVDLGTTFGWAFSAGTVIHSGSAYIGVRKGESPGMRGLRFWQWLDGLHSQGWRPFLVAYEKVEHHGQRGHTNTQAAHIYGGLEMILQAWCAQHNIQHTHFTPSEIKKHATGKGNCDKEKMIGAAKLRGWRPVDDNEADALWILDLACHTYPQAKEIGS